jgi:hypothetical protein
MNKLSDLRDHLLSFKNITNSDHLLTFAEQGSVIFHKVPTGAQNLGFFDAQTASDDFSFVLKYNANIIFTDCTADFKSLVFIVMTWASANQTDLKPEDVKFHADILDKKRTDISFIIPLSELVIVTAQEDGHNIEAIPDNDALGIKLVS